MDEYSEEFLSGVEGAPKAAVKRLTARIEDEILKLTVNGEDW
jgi:glycerol-3-phosphate O-acyltransferase/dihydroxyacetone phosphate acyltransferase